MLNERCIPGNQKTILHKQVRRQEPFISESLSENREVSPVPSLFAAVSVVEGREPYPLGRGQSPTS
jgi:hypothetical protein